jgi:iron complex outermembrane recepter protein
MHPFRQPPVARGLRGLPWLLALVLCCLPDFAQAQETGSIAGRVVNPATGEYLRNARISVEGTTLSTVSGDGGAYRLNGVPAGEARIHVLYTGLDPLSQTVNVVAGQTVRQDLSLGSTDYGDAVLLGEFRVSGIREGNARAIMQQRVAINPTKVIASDALGNVSEGNVGEFLKLMPGVVMDYVEADTRSVRIRGLNPKYALVLIDGMQPASAGSSNIATGRSFEFEQLSISSVETVELSKTPTPDQPSSVAGIVNLRTRSAFDREGRHIEYTVGLATNSYYASLKRTEGWDNEKHRKLLPNYQFEYSEVFADGKLGVVAGVNKHYTIAAQKHIWFFTNDFNADRSDNATEVPVINRIWYQDGPKPTERGNYNLRLDYKFADNFTLYGRFDWNTYDARFYNRTLSLRPTTYAPGATKTDQTVTVGRISTDSNQFMTKEGDTMILTGGAMYSVGNVTANLGLHYSRARNWYDNLVEGHFTDYSSSINNISWRMTRPTPSSTDLTFTQLSGGNWRDLNNYRFDNNSIGWHERRSKDQQWTARLDLTHDLTQAPLPQTLKYGALVNMMVRDVTRYGFLATNPTGPDGTLGTGDDLLPAHFVDPVWRSNWDFGGSLDNWPALSPWRLYEHYRANPGSWRDNTAAIDLNRLQNNWDFEETITAAYLQDLFTFGSFSIAPGVRYERTESDGKGINRVNNQTLRAGTSYDAWLKYLHLNYEFSRNIIARASYHDAITRADIGNLIPGITGVDHTARTVTGANPDLREERSKTVNLSLEYYFEPVGQFTIGAFRTEVRDRQFANQTTLGSDGYAGDTQYAGYTLFAPVNIAAPTKLHGFEIDYQQQLSFLPGALRGLGVFANYTRLSYDDWGFYTNSAKAIANGGVQFQHKRLLARVNANWVGKLLQNPARTYNPVTNVWTNSAPNVEVYQKDRLSVDINIEYELRPWLTVFLDGRNVFNEPSQYTYRGVEENFERILKTGGIWLAGVKGRF